jgi:hypothetical protein
VSTKLERSVMQRRTKRLSRSSKTHKDEKQEARRSLKRSTPSAGQLGPRFIPRLRILGFVFCNVSLGQCAADLSVCTDIESWRLAASIDRNIKCVFNFRVKIGKQLHHVDVCDEV